MNLPEKLSTLAREELYNYKGVLSCLRLSVLALEKGHDKPDENLDNTRQNYMDSVDKAHREYLSALDGVGNAQLRSALLMKSPGMSVEFPEYAEVFGLLEEIRGTVDKLSERNGRALELTSRMMRECRENIKAVKKRKALVSVYEPVPGSNSGSLLNFSENR